MRRFSPKTLRDVSADTPRQIPIYTPRRISMKPPMNKKPLKKQNKPKPAPALALPIFSYTSKCCSVQAIKSPCMFVGSKSKEAETQGLGGWRCSACHKPCKCNRHKNEKVAGEQQTLKIVLDKAPEIVL